MKKLLLIGAMALAFASPTAAAQAAPAANPHQGHDMSQMQGHDMSQMQHGQMQHGQGQTGQHQDHAAQGDCCGDRNGNGRMDCCEHMAQGQSCCEEHQPARPAPSQPSGNR